MRPSVTIFLFALCFGTHLLRGQDLQVDIEDLFDGEDDAGDPSMVIDYLTELAQNSLDLNRATVQQLSTIPWLSAAAAGDIIRYRAKHQSFSSIDELKQIKSVLPHYEKVKYFVTVGRRWNDLQINAEGRHRLISYDEAWREPFYVNSKLLNRFKGEWRNHLAVGLLVEKDAGEKQFDDLLLGNLMINLKPMRTRVILGNFTAEFGQSLVFGGPYRFSKGSDPISPTNSSRNGLYPYLSVDENFSFRGVGASTNWRGFSLTGFYSRKQRDARIENDAVLSLPTSGLHRTDSEIANRDQLRENSTGSVLSWRPNPRLSLGSTWLASTFDYEFSKKDGTNYIPFSGRTNQVRSVFYNATPGMISLFGEYAVCTSGGRAIVSGVSAEMNPVEWVVLWRNYDEDFQNLYASGFGERSDTRNETGFYLGCRYHAAKRSIVSFYYDQFKFDWPTATAPMLASGDELLLYVEHGFSAQLAVTMRLKVSNKSAAEKFNDTMNNSITRLATTQTRAYRLQLDYDASRILSFRTRMEWSQAGVKGAALCSQDTIGVLLYQQIAVSQKRFRLAARWTMFDAVSYPLRFYQVEQDLPGALRLIMLYGRGVRWYAAASYSILEKFRLSVKFEQTVYDFRVSDGDKLDSGLSLQADWRF
jgi:hypothetical protein